MHRPSHALAGWLSCLAGSGLFGLQLAAAAETPTVSTILDVLNSVHVFSEVALSPDGKRLVYGSVSTGKRGGG